MYSVFQAVVGSPPELGIYISATICCLLFATALHTKFKHLLQRWHALVCLCLWLVFLAHILVVTCLCASSIQALKLSCLLMMLATLACYTLLPWGWRWAGVAAPVANAIHLVAVMYPIGSYNHDKNSLTVQWSKVQVNVVTGCRGLKWR